MSGLAEPPSGRRGRGMEMERTENPGEPSSLLFFWVSIYQSVLARPLSFTVLQTLSSFPWAPERYMKANTLCILRVLVGTSVEEEMDKLGISRKMHCLQEKVRKLANFLCIQNITVTATDCCTSELPEFLCSRWWQSPEGRTRIYWQACDKNCIFPLVFLQLE